MRSKMLFIFLAMNIACLQAGAAEVFLYRAYYPTDVNCQQTASKTIELFKSQTGAQVIATKCVTTNVGDLDQTETSALTIQYVADQEVYPRPFVIGGAVGSPASVSLGSTNQGAYSDLKTCQADIAPQTDLFKKLFKFEPVDSYCEAAEDYSGQYVLRMDVFQDTGKALFVLNSFEGSAQPEDFTRVEQLLISSGARPIHRSGGNFYFYDEVKVNQPVHVNIQSQIALISERDSDCDSQKAALSQIISKVEADYVIACTKSDPDGLPNYSGSAVEIVSSGLSTWNFDRASINGYRTLGECEQDLDRVLKNARSLRKNTFGGVCGYVADPAGAYEVILVSRWPA